MVGKNNKYLKTTKEGTKVESYSIRLLTKRPKYQ